MKFDSGATVSKVSLRSDYKCSTINMENLPANTSRLSVIKLLAAAVTTSKTMVELRLFSHWEQKTCSAFVKSDDASFIETACSKLNSLAPFPGFKASIMPIKYPVSQSPYQVDCRKVLCAWNRPTREANLIFGDKTTALIAHKILKARECNVVASKISIAYPNDLEHQRKWVIKLEGLSEATKEQDIIEAIPKFDRPHTVHLGEPSHVSDPDRDSGILKSMLLELGPLEQWSVSSDTNGKRFNAYATFFHESSARDAVAILRDKSPFKATAKPSVALVASVSFEMENKIYDIVSPQIDKLKTVWTRQHIIVSIIPSRYPFRMLTLECEDHQLLVQAKAALEEVISGQIIRMDGKDLRFGNFQRFGKGLQQIKSIEDSFKVVIIPDIRKSQFRIFRQEECPQSTLDEITIMLQDCTPEGHVIELNDADFLWASKGGFRVLKSQLGGGKLSFHNFTPRNRCIFVRGSMKNYNIAIAIIASKKIIAAKKAEMECPSCLCEAQNPIRMSCGHVYCSDCFIEMCEAEKTATREFRICCVKAINASGTECQRPFSLSELQEHLPAEAFEAVLEKSFESYVSHHPGDLTYCQTPDCDQVYRISPPGTERPSTFTCKKCLVSICTFCHNSHPGKPCDEAKRIAQTVLSDETKKALGIKACPECSMLMQKRAGCDHMTCKCGAHVCWVCLMSFTHGSACYAHLTDTHDGIRND